MAMDTGRVASQTLEFGAWFDLVIGGAFNQQVAGVTSEAENAGTKFAETLNMGQMEMVTRIKATENTMKDCLAKMVDMQAEIKMYQKEKEEKDEERDSKKEKKKIKSGDIKEASCHTPSQWEGRGDRATFREFADDVKNWADALTIHGVKLIEAAETRQSEITETTVQELCEIDDGDEAKEFLKDFDTRLYRMLKKHVGGEAAKFVKNPTRSGMKAWKSVTGQYDPQDAAGKTAAYATVSQPGKRAKDPIEARQLIKEWQMHVDDYERRYGRIECQQKISVTMGLLPANAVDGTFRARTWPNFEAMMLEITPWLEYRTTEEVTKSMKTKKSEEAPVDMDISSLNTLQAKMKEDIIAALGGKGGKPWGGKGGKGGKPWTDYGAKANGYQPKGEQEGVKGDKGKGKGCKGGFQGECYKCGEYGHSQRYCKKNGRGGLNSCEEEGEAEEHEQEGQEEKEDEEEGWGYMMMMEEEKPEEEWRPWNKTFKNQGKGWDPTPSENGEKVDQGRVDAQGGRSIGQSVRQPGKVGEVRSILASGNLDLPDPCGCKGPGAAKVGNPPAEEPNRVAKPLEKKGSRTKRTWERLEEWKFKRPQGKEEGEYINTLSDTKPEESEREVIFAFSDKGDKDGDSEWVKIEAYVDSAAVANVMKGNVIPGIKMVESEGSKKGQNWWSASNHPIKNEGQKLIPFKTTCGKKRRIMFQIANVSKSLVSVDALNETGHDVVLNKKNPRIICPNGEEIKLRRKNKVFVLDMFVRVSPFAGR